jgi:hypothetical protein
VLGAEQRRQLRAGAWDDHLRMGERVVDARRMREQADPPPPQ